jgi:hypothetical protein
MSDLRIVMSSLRYRSDSRQGAKILENRARAVHGAKRTSLTHEISLVASLPLGWPHSINTLVSTSDSLPCD